MSKTCTKCGETKPLDGFHRDKTKAGGRRQNCKECVRESARRSREKNRDKRREYDRRYREENRDELREYFRRYREENREKVMEYERRSREKNRDKQRERNRRYREENRDKRRECERRYRKENRDILNQGQKIRHAQHTRISNLLADRKGTPYSPEEDALVLADNGMTDYQKAIELGRTWGSVAARRRNLRARANH